MKQKELTKNPFALQGLYKHISALNMLTLVLLNMLTSVC